MRPFLALLAPLALTLAACRSTPEAAAETSSFTWAFLVTGPSTVERSEQERQELQLAHLANMGKLAEQGRLLVAGPFGQPNPDPKLRGIFVLGSTSKDEAQSWIA